MTKSLKEVKSVTAVAEIQHYGEKLILPSGMSIDDAMATLQRRKEYEMQQTALSDTFDVFPWDGAFALKTVLDRKFGWAQAINTPGFFGENPPKMIGIETGPHSTDLVPWGRFSLPGIQGYLETGTTIKNELLIFSLSATVLRLYEDKVREIFEQVRQELARNSLYRGKALKIRFRDDDGKKLALPTLKFIDTALVNETLAVYPDSVFQAIHTNLYTPISRAKDCLANGIPLKRGILLGGTFGTGKTLAASVASKLAVEAGITYVYVPRADELSDAIQFARQYQSPACVTFCEDIDRVVSGERDIKMDDILNVIDGIDAKNNNIIVVLTTNDLNAINAAMLRPGRLDAVIEITPPDCKAVERLIRLYAGGTIEPEVDLTAAGELLAGNIPAVIAEVVKRAKLAQLALQANGTHVTELTQQAILNAAATMQSQVDLLKRCMQPPPKEETLDSAMVRTIRASMNGEEARTN